jgi:hypothetical protein
MSPILAQARALLLSRGLHGEEYNANCLNVWAKEVPSASGLVISHDLSRLYADEARLTAQFPGPGQCRYEIAGDPEEVVAKVLAVYGLYLREGGTLGKAVSKTIPDSEHYLTIRPGRE